MSLEQIDSLVGHIEDIFSEQLYFSVPRLRNALGAARGKVTGHVPAICDSIRDLFVDTEAKIQSQLKKSPVLVVAEQVLFPAPGHTVKFQDFYEMYQGHCYQNSIQFLWNVEVIRQLRRAGYLVARYTNNTTFIGNVAVEESLPHRGLFRVNERRRLVA